MSFKSGIGGNMLGYIQEPAQEVRQTRNNKKVANATIRVSEGYGDNKELTFVQCTFWEKDADSIIKYPKNHPLYIEGLITATGYMSSENEPKAQMKCNVQSWRSLQALPKDEPPEEQPPYLPSEQNSYQQPVQNNRQGITQQQVTRNNETLQGDTVVLQQQNDVKQQIETDTTLEKSYNHVFNSGSYKGKTIRQVAEEDIAYLIRVAHERANRPIGVMCKLVVDDTARVASYTSDDDLPF